MMKIKIRSSDVKFSMPVPVSMIGFVIRMIPDKMFEEMRKNTPEPYSSLVTRDTLSIIATDCLDVLKENKGLEIVHVEARDGTFISIRL